MTALIIGLCMLAGWHIAKWRGHLPWVGLIAGIFGPLGLLLVAVVPPKRRQVEP